VPGFTLDERQTSLLADIVAACAATGEDALPREVLIQIQALLGADAVTFSGFDTLLPHAWLHQCLEPSGELWYGGETPTEALNNPFWETYWDGPCSYPDRSRDYVSVTMLSDFLTLASIRAGAAGRSGREYEREIIACLPGRTPGRHLRLICLRERGSDFSERDRFFLSLLRPHLERAFWLGRRAREEPPSLTRRQLQIMRMVQTGLTNGQIAHQMELSEGTVQTHLNNIYARLHVPSRTAAVQKVFGVSDSWPEPHDSLADSDHPQRSGGPNTPPLSTGVVAERRTDHETHDS